MSERYKAIVPGKLMLFGEHAVLRRKMALVCSVDKYMQITLTPRTDSIIDISSQLGNLQVDLNSLKTEYAFRFVLQTIQHYRSVIDSGFNLSIQSEFPENLGLGSSAAVTAATAAAICSCRGLEKNKKELFRDCLEIIQNVQGRGSGADLAASIYGGIVAYQMTPLQITPLKKNYPITAIYAGYKTSTVKVIQQVDQFEKKFPKLSKRIFEDMNICTMLAIDAIEKEQWEKVGKLMNIHQGFMDAIGVNDETLSHIIYAIRRSEGILGAKISGSGLGDCVIALGRAGNPNLPFQTISLKTSSQGLAVEKI